MKDNLDTPIEEDALSIELPDAVLDDVADNRPQHQSAMPAGIKYGLMGLSFLVIVVGIVVFNAFSQPDVVEETLVFDQATLSDIANQASPVARPALPVATVPVPAEQVSGEDAETVKRLDAMVLTLQQALDQSSSWVAKQRDAAARQGSGIQEVKVSLEQSRALLTETTRQMDELKARLATLESHVGQNRDRLQQLKTKATRKRQAGPSFQLLSIDRWGDRDSVVLGLQDKTTVAAIGDSRAGWSIQSIEPPNCIGVVRLTDQTQAKVCLKRSS